MKIEYEDLPSIVDIDRDAAKDEDKTISVPYTLKRDQGIKNSAYSFFRMLVMYVVLSPNSRQ